MPFVKLDCGILNSTLWFERDAREVFITALLMAEPFELREPTAQISVDSLEPTGWTVPAGWYGFVPAAGIGIIHRARVDETTGRAALAQLGSPEISSRSPEFDGRRLVRIDGGYLVLNFIKYREKDATAADRQRRWRERQKLKEDNAESRVTEPPSRVISNQAEAEAEVQKQKKRKSTALAVSDRFEEFYSLYPASPNNPGPFHAKNAWRKLKPDADLQTTIIDAIRRQREWPQSTKEGGRFVCTPQKWLVEHRWLAPDPPDADGTVGRVITAELRKRAEQFRRTAWSRCMHDPKCATYASCVEEIAREMIAQPEEQPA